MERDKKQTKKWSKARSLLAGLASKTFAFSRPAPQAFSVKYNLGQLWKLVGQTLEKKLDSLYAIILVLSFPEFTLPSTLLSSLISLLHHFLASLLLLLLLTNRTTLVAG